MSVTKEASLGDIISVRTESAEPLSFYRAMGLEVNLRDHVIVETDRGVEYGQVVGLLMTATRRWSSLFVQL